MANQIILKRSATPGKVPTTSQLALGEIGINTYDGLIYIKKDDGTPSVVQIGGVTSVNSKTGAVSLSTTDISEGSGLYFTQVRARGAVSATGDLAYNAATGVFSYSTPTTIASLSNHNTDDLTEGSTNKYYADSLARGAISVTAGVGGYNASTGVISIPNNTNQLTNGANFATQSFVTSAVSAISTSTISQGNSNISVVDTGTGTVTVTVDGSTALTVTADGVVVAGNFTVSGTTTTVNSNTVAVADNILTLNSDVTGTPTQNAGIEIERGTSTNVQLRWNEGTQTWTFTNDGSVYYPLAVSTTDLAEGTNQYFTTTRARTSISATSASGVSYNNTSGVISLSSIPNSSLVNNSISINGTSVSLGGSRTLGTDDIAEGSTNQYFTTARARSSVSASGSLSYNSSTGVFSYTTPTTIASLSNHTTTNLSEGTNLYYTDARARAAVSASGDLTYSSATGVISFTQNKAWSALTGTPTTIAGYGITNAYTKTEVDSAITAAVQTKDNTDEITEGTTNLYFTNARARSAVSVSGSLSYNSSTGVISYTTPTTSGITEGTNLYYTDARARAAVSAGTGISYSSSTGVISNAGVTSLNGSTGAKTLTQYHATYQTVTAAQETANASGAVNFTFSDLSGSVFHLILVNRMPLRPTEYSVSGTTLTIASGFGLTLGDEIEVTGSKLA